MIGKISAIRLKTRLKTNRHAKWKKWTKCTFHRFSNVPMGRAFDSSKFTDLVRGRYRLRPVSIVLSRTLERLCTSCTKYRKQIIKRAGADEPPAESASFSVGILYRLLRPNQFIVLEILVILIVWFIINANTKRLLKWEWKFFF